MRAWLTTPALLAALLGAPSASASTTSAEPPEPAAEQDALRVVLLPLEVEGTLAESWRGELHQALRRGLADGNMVVVSGPQGEALEDCRETSCITATSRDARAEGVVRARIAVVDRDYDVVIELLDSGGETVATSEESCAVCGMAEVVALVRGQAAALRGRLLASTLDDPVLEIRSTPPGAEVRVDGTLVGTTPLRHQLPAGPHRITLDARGYSTEVREVEAAAGVRETLEVELHTDDDPRRRRRIAGASLTGVGAGATVAGAVLWGLDSRPAPGDRCRGSNVDPQGRCRYLYDTRTMGIAVTTVGVALVATGVGLLISGRRRRGGQGPRDLAGLVLR